MCRGRDECQSRIQTFKCDGAAPPVICPMPFGGSSSAVVPGEIDTRRQFAKATGRFCTPPDRALRGVHLRDHAFHRKLSSPSRTLWFSFCGATRNCSTAVSVAYSA